MVDFKYLLMALSNIAGGYVTSAVVLLLYFFKKSIYNLGGFLNWLVYLFYIYFGIYSVRFFYCFLVICIIIFLLVFLCDFGFFLNLLHNFFLVFLQGFELLEYNYLFDSLDINSLTIALPEISNISYFKGDSNTPFRQRTLFPQFYTKNSLHKFSLYLNSHNIQTDPFYARMQSFKSNWLKRIFSSSAVAQAEVPKLVVNFYDLSLRFIELRLNYNGLYNNYLSVQAQLHDWIGKYDILQKKFDDIQGDVLHKHVESLQRQYDLQKMNYDSVKEALKSANVDYDTAVKEQTRLSMENVQLKSKNLQLEAENSTFREQIEILMKGVVNLAHKPK